MFYEYFWATGACEAVQGLSDLFSTRLQNDEVQDSTFDGIRLYLQQATCLQMWKVCTSQKLQDAVQLQTVLALYDQENVRNNEPPNYSRWKTMVTRHTQFQSPERNSGKRSSNQESKKGEKPARKGRWENAISGQQLDNVRKEIHAVSVTMDHLETDAIIDKKDNRPLLHQKRRHRLTERYPQRGQEAEVRALLEKEDRFRAETSLGESVRICRVIIGTIPCVSISSLNQDAHVATNVGIDTLKLMVSPVKSLRKVVEKDQLPH